MNYIIQEYSALGIRESNEDALFIKKESDNYLIAGIFDGHGGSDISKGLVTEKINICKYFYQSNSNFNKYNYKNIINIFIRVQEKLKNYYQSANKMGSTVLFCLLNYFKNKINVKIINLGDSRAVLCNKYNIAVALNLDHKPNIYYEKIRIEKMGGVITYSVNDDPRINGMSVSRALGDLDNPYISNEPDVYDYVLNNDKFIILACDGLWDVLSNQNAVDFINEKLILLENKKKSLIDLKKKNELNIAYLLADYAINVKKSTDNISIIIIFFQKSS